MGNNRISMVVLTTSKRINHTVEELRLLLNNAGFMGEIIDVTPTDKECESLGVRGFEIQTWRDAYGHVGKFCILDDSSDMIHLMPYLVHIDNEYGLQEAHVERAVKLLLDKAVP